MKNKFNLFTILFFILLLSSLLLFTPIYANQISTNPIDQYYADISIDIDNQGNIQINGISNHPFFNNETDPNLFITKSKGYWLLNITTNDIFSNYIYTINLPKNAEINYIKTQSKFRLTTDYNSLKIIGYAENNIIDLVIQYQIKQNTNQYTFIKTSYIPIFFLFIIFTIALLSFIFILIKNKKYKTNNTNEDEPTTQLINSLPDRQKNIYNILKENKFEITQKEIETILKIPKSSVSRNIQSLIKKGIITKIPIGLKNKIILNEKYKN
jgi:uncharacterized membrane protein